MFSRSLYVVMVVCLAATACSTQKRVARLADKTLLRQPELATAHVGISIMDANSKQYLYNYQGNKYFIPASNTKLLTCYAAMKYLGDSLEGLRYRQPERDPSGHTVIRVEPTGDPTFLHPDFRRQPVLDFLKKDSGAYYVVTPGGWKETAWGNGWAWNDYQDDYMAERSVFPVYGNVIRIARNEKQFSVQPSRFAPEYDGVAHAPAFHPLTGNYTYRRAKNENRLLWSPAGSNPAARKSLYQETPFITDRAFSVLLLRDTLPGLQMELGEQPGAGEIFTGVVYSQPVDSMLRLMMHRSDNFFAEQSLLMVSHRLVHAMNDAAVIDSLLAGDYAGMPQAPKWVDGSGLSRYNLVTPQDFVWLLHQMKQHFSWQRITGILPTGGEGTLGSYYKKYAGRIYAKTGTLSNNVSLSGYLVTRKGRTLSFSVMVNNHKAAVSNIRREVAAFLGKIIEQY